MWLLKPTLCPLKSPLSVCGSVLLQTTAEKLWIISNLQFEKKHKQIIGLNWAHRKDIKATSCLREGNGRGPTPPTVKNNHAKKLTVRIFMRSLSFSQWVCVVYVECVWQEKKRDAGQWAGPQEWSPVGCNSSNITERPLSLQPNREVLFRANCNVTPSSWKTQPPETKPQWGKLGVQTGTGGVRIRRSVTPLKEQSWWQKRPLSHFSE